MSVILVIEDDAAILSGLIAGFEAEHYTVLTAADGITGEEMAIARKPDLILLDLMLPGRNGEVVCRSLRERGMMMPIIMLTAKTSEIDAVLGLEIGADDYVKKPFSLRELLARVKAHLRRVQGRETKGKEDKGEETVRFGNVRVDLKGRLVSRSGNEFPLAGKEFDVLKYLIEHEGEVVARAELLDKVWGYEHFPTTRTVDNYILALRKKIEDDPSQPHHLLTVPTVGYRFVKGEDVTA